MPLALVLALAPATIFALAALFIHRTARSSARRAFAIAAAAAVAGLAASLGLAAIVWRQPAPLQITVSPWFRMLAEQGPALQFDRLGAVCLVLIAALVAVTTLRGRASGDGGALAGPLLVAAASALFVVAADAPLGLVFAWLALDATLLLVGETTPAVIVVNQFGLAMVLAGLVGLPFEAPEGGVLGLTSVAAVNRTWLLGAAAVRMGLYPLWWALPRTTSDRVWRACASRLAPTVAGGYLVLRLTASTHLGEGLNLHTLAPVLVATFGGALLAWLAANRAVSLDWQATFHASLVVMAASVGGSFGQAVGLLLLVDLVLTRSALYAAEGLAAPRAVRVARWMLVASAAGLPPTLGFAGRWLLYREILAADMPVVLILTVLAGGLATMALFEAVRLRAPVGRTDRPSLAAVLALAGAGVVLGALVGRAPLAGITGAVLPSALGDLRSTLANPLTRATTGVALLTAVIVPIVPALVVRRPPDAFAGTRRQALRRVLELGAALDAASRALIRVGEWFHRGTGLLESRRAMSWTLMAAAVTGTAMLAATPSVNAAVDRPTVTAAVAFALAGAVAVTMVMASAPATTLGALAGGYVVAAAVLVDAGAPVPISAVKLIVGGIVLAILGISVVQTPSEHHLASAARRLRSLRGSRPDEAQRWIAAFAVAACLLVAFGVRSASMPDQLPTSALHVALALSGGGVLAAVFARDALRLAAGVLLAMIGFEVAYTLIDPGLVITGAIAGFELLFAVVASVHVGLVADEAAS